MTLAIIRKNYETALEWLIIALMATLAIEVIAGVVFRTLGVSLSWYDEVASVLLAWLTFYGSALAAVKRSHIGCPEVVALMPPNARVAFAVIVEVLVFAFFALLAWVGWDVLEVLATDHLVSLPQISVRTVQSVIPISAVLIILAEALNLPLVLAEARAGHATGVDDKAREASH